jgi:hypothetical protein
MTKYPTKDDWKSQAEYLQRKSDKFEKLYCDVSNKYAELLRIAEEMAANLKAWELPVSGHCDCNACKSIAAFAQFKAKFEGEK